MENTITIDKELSSEVEALQYEVTSLKSLLAYLYSAVDVTVPEARIEKLEAKFAATSKEYEKAKAKVEKLVFANFTNPVSWSLDFETSVVTVTL